MWLYYFLCLALIVEFTNEESLFAKILSKVSRPKNTTEWIEMKEISKGNDQLTDLKGTDDKATTVSEDAEWCQDHIDTWDCEDYKEAGYCDDIYGKHYHLCEKTCTNGTCKSPFL